MKNLPKISCIMSTFNSEKYLNIAVDSILNQSFSDFELIISDGGSTDTTKDIIKQYMAKDDRIKFIDNKKNLTNCECLIQCLNIAKGEFIAIMESDDFSLPDRFKLEIDAFKNDNNLYLVCGYGYIIDEIGDKKYDYFVSENYNEIRKRCLFSTPFITPGVMFKKELGTLLKKVKYPYIWDTDLYLNTIFSNKKCINIPKLVIKKRELDNSLLFRKFYTVSKQHLIFRLQTIFKYKVYKEQKFIVFKVIWNDLINFLGYYTIPITKRIGIYNFAKKIYHSYLKV